MASGIKTVLLSQTDKQFFTSVVADTSSALTYDLINWEFVIIEADVVAANTYVNSYIGPSGYY